MLFEDSLKQQTDHCLQPANVSSHKQVNDLNTIFFYCEQIWTTEKSRASRSTKAPLSYQQPRRSKNYNSFRTTVQVQWKSFSQGDRASAIRDRSTAETSLRAIMELCTV